MRAFIRRSQGLFLSLLLCGFASGAANAEDAFQARVFPLLQRYCVECHSDENPEAGIAFDVYADQAEAVEDGDTWLQVLDVLESRAMPPADREQPALDELDRIIQLD